MTPINGIYTFESGLLFFHTYNIGYYVLDVLNKVKEKFIVPKNSSNYPPFICYIIDDHVYVVTDKRTRAHIVRSSQKGSLFISEPKHKKGKLEEDKVAYDVKVEDLKNCTVDVVYYNKANLRDILVTLYKTKGENEANKVVDNNVVSILYEDKEAKRKIQLKNNPNAVHKISEVNGIQVSRSVDQKDIMKFCDLFNLQFKNQSITGIANELWAMFRQQGVVQRRINLSIKLKNKILKEQGHRCAKCDCKLQYYEFDHVTRLVDRGGELEGKYSSLVYPLP